MTACLLPSKIEPRYCHDNRLTPSQIQLIDRFVVHGHSKQSKLRERARTKN